jgi:hypothetical protein
VQATAGGDATDSDCLLSVQGAGPGAAAPQDSDTDTAKMWGKQLAHRLPAHLSHSPPRMRLHRDPRQNLTCNAQGNACQYLGMLLEAVWAHEGRGAQRIQSFLVLRSLSIV